MINTISRAIIQYIEQPCYEELTHAVYANLDVTTTAAGSYAGHSPREPQSWNIKMTQKKERQTEASISVLTVPTLTGLFLNPRISPNSSQTRTFSTSCRPT
ncbi:hypothetical protein FRC19_001082 [Serendipita sp. 401]|nr:hypothetical protein FRC19_001082 [Serendipita sp. 401]